ncbi:MAG: exodeoxyribonuclease III [Candidatus Colwellbacteria bacterium]|nr:exodeoxyribonuclease III [Candidatus Colwellbacteria bacterium]
MKFASWNVNGLRSIYRKGLFEVVFGNDPDIATLQEIKSSESDLSPDIKDVLGYHSFFFPAEKKGYSGVAIYSKLEPTAIEKGIGYDRFDKEGRAIFLEFPGFFFGGLYMPHGGRQKENLDYKMTSYDSLMKYVSGLKGKPVIIAGDMNIAHKPIDLARPKENADNICFTPGEREKFGELISMGFADTFREKDDSPGKYTWWSYMSGVRDRNIGWRLDYVLSLSEPASIKDVAIRSDIKGSDHAPISADIDVDVV